MVHRGIREDRLGDRGLARIACVNMGGGTIPFRIVLHSMPDWYLDDPLVSSKIGRSVEIPFLIP